MRKYRLATPGPTNVPPEALLELAKPVRHHRTAENKAAIADACRLLKQAFQAEQSEVLLLTSSGTGAMEMAAANLLGPGVSAIVMSAGKWGERWQELAQTFGAEVILLEAPYGEAIGPERLAEALRARPDAAAVFATLCETSTGVAMDVRGYGEAVRGTPAVLVVDGIAGAAADECRCDEWGVDMLVAGSQKALMLPPGLAFVTVSAKAKAAAAARTPAAYYFHLGRYLKAMAEGDTPYTPAHTLIAALAATLKLLLEQPMEVRWHEHAAMAGAFREACGSLGLEVFGQRPSAALTAVRVPAGIDGAAWAKLLEKKHGLKVADGQGNLKGQILRFAHMGWCDGQDIVGMVAAMEWSLAELGHPVSYGAAVATATQCLMQLYLPPR